MNNKEIIILFSNVDIFSIDKRLELKHRIEEMERSPHVIALQEVKPKNYRYDRSTAEYVLDGYDIIEQNLHNEEGRGLMVYVKKGMKFHTVELKVKFCEYCCIEICCTGGNLLIVSVYRSPSSDINNNKNLMQLMQEVSDINVEYKILLGDFNLPQIRWSNYSTESGPVDFNTVFIEKVRDCFLTQHIQEVTRIRGDNAGSTLDLLFTIDEDIITDSLLGRSDHACIFVSVNMQELDNTKKQIFMYEKADYELMKRKLDIDWLQYLGQDSDTEEKWTKFRIKMHEVTEECIPKKLVGINRTRKRTNENLPMNRKLWIKMKKKQRRWERLKRARRDTCRSVETEYRRLNNQVRRETRNAIKIKEREVAKHVKINPKFFWKYVASKIRMKSRIGDLYRDNEKTEKDTGNKEKANLLSEQFSGVFIEEPEGESPPATPRYVPRLDNINITKGKIRKVLQRLKIDKSPGPDGIHPRVIKELREELLEPLSILFTSSLQEGVVPDDWKIANVTAIFKKGNRSEPGNYRPVSLTSVLCKVMETLLREEIMQHMKENKLFSNKQFGFISGRSTLLQLIKVLDSWTEAVDDGLAIDVVYLDFMKAFDRVPHKRLLEKVSSYNIEGMLLKWIQSFLTGRR